MLTVTGYGATLECGGSTPLSFLSLFFVRAGRHGGKRRQRKKAASSRRTPKRQSGVEPPHSKVRRQRKKAASSRRTPKRQSGVEPPHSKVAPQPMTVRKNDPETMPRQ
jgi:hypothetical protein